MTIRRFAIAAAIATALTAPAAIAAEKPLVAVTAIVEHPSLNAIRDGVKAGLADAGYKDGDAITFEYESAQGNPATATQIAQKFAGQQPAVIVPITTPSSQAVASATQDIPVVFAAVTDPVGARLVKSLDHPGANITGVSDFPPLAQQLDLIKELFPNAKTIGVLYNPAEANSVSTIAAMEEMAGEWKVNIISAAAPKSSDVQAAAQSLVGKADVFYVPNDNTVVSALESAVDVAIANRIPFISSDPDSVTRGALATVSFDQFEIGRAAGKMAARVLKGEKPGDIAVQNGSTASTVVNAKTAAAIGVTLPQAVLDRAKVIR